MKSKTKNKRVNFPKLILLTIGGLLAYLSYLYVFGSILTFLQVFILKIFWADTVLGISPANEVLWIIPLSFTLLPLAYLWEQEMRKRRGTRKLSGKWPIFIKVVSLGVLASIVFLLWKFNTILTPDSLYVHGSRVEFSKVGKIEWASRWHRRYSRMNSGGCSQSYHYEVSDDEGKMLWTTDGHKRDFESQGITDVHKMLKYVAARSGSGIGSYEYPNMSNCHTYSQRISYLLFLLALTVIFSAVSWLKKRKKGAKI